MDVTVINPFITGLSDVLTDMVKLEFALDKIRLKTDKDNQRAITGFIDLTCASTKGSLAICFDKEVILDIYLKLLEEEVSELGEEVADCVGEITNMVCGTAKSLLSEQGHQFDLTTPQTIIGEEKPIPHVQEKPIIIIPFTCVKGEFHMEVTLQA